MSDREAFEKWARDNGIRYQSKYSTGEYYFGDADLAWKAWQAAQAQAPDPVAVADKGVINWIDGKQFDHEADLYTQPAVNQQLTLGDLNTIRQWHNAIKDAYVNYLEEQDAAVFAKIKAAIAAAQEQREG